MIVSVAHGKRLYELSNWVIGVDEVGLGCIAGPVVTGGVLIRSSVVDRSIRDSKKMTPGARERAFGRIIHDSEAFCLVLCPIADLNSSGIFASKQRALIRTAQHLLMLCPEALVFVDGNQPLRKLRSQEQVCLQKADDHLLAVSMASVLAKVYRDRIMSKLEDPGYGYAKHKGYPTPEHLRALHELGPSAHHRLGTAPVAMYR